MTRKDTKRRAGWPSAKVEPAGSRTKRSSGAPEPVAVVEVPERKEESVAVVAQPELEPEPVAVVAQPEPEPEPVAVAAQPEPEPDPVAAVAPPEPEPVAVVAQPEPEPEPVAAVAPPEPVKERPSRASKGLPGSRPAAAPEKPKPAAAAFVATTAVRTGLREMNMGPLTRDMARLHDEIVSARNQRHNLMANVKASSDARKESVGRMTEGFLAARMDMKAQMAASHARFLGNLQKHVGDLRRDMANDLAGARQAFQGGRS